MIQSMDRWTDGIITEYILHIEREREFMNQPIRNLHAQKYKKKNRNRITKTTRKKQEKTKSMYDNFTDDNLRK